MGGARLRQALKAATLACAFLGAAHAHRSHSAVAEFKRAHPCPSTGKPSGACPGWIVDHVVALRCGGADKPTNMQWQTAAAAKAKDGRELRGCVMPTPAIAERWP